MRAADQRGFTLLEVLIAFAIAALALVLLFRAASGGLLSVETAGRYEEAVARAQSHLASVGRDGPIAPGQQEGDDGGGFHWRVEVSQLAAGQVRSAGLPGTTTGGPPPPMLYAVAVTMTWHDAGKGRSYVLRTERMGLGNAG